MGSGILVLNQPGVYLVDADGNVITLADGDTIGSAEALLVAGKDGTVARYVGVDSAGKAAIQDPPNLDAALSTRASAAAQTDGTQKTQVNNGANILGVNASGQAAVQNPPNLDAALSTRASETTLASIKDTDGVKKITDALPTGDNVIGRTKVTDGTNVQGVNASGQAAIQDPPNLDVALSTRATESTLQAADTKLGTIDSVLDSIKDTDGIKKIQDGLPPGTNEIGKVAQGTKAIPADAWPFYVVDNSGNIVGVVVDGSVYRLQTAAKIAKGNTSSGLVHLEAIDTVAGEGRLKTSVYTPDGDPVAFGAISSSLKNEFVMYSGSNSLLVDGSVTPVVFTYDSDATYDISIQEIKFTLVGNVISFGSNYFGSTPGPLTNGLLVQVVTVDGTITLYNLRQNESFVNFASPGGFEWVVSSKDMMTSNYLIGGGLKLRANSGDQVKVTVRDDIDSCGVYFRCFVKGNLLTSV
jgi:hypothetical protein